MSNMNFAHNFMEKINVQRSYFESNKSLSFESRYELLTKLKQVILNNEEKLLEALKVDLGKHAIDGYLTEVGFILGELDFTIKNLHKWMRPKQVPGPWVQFPSRNYIQHVPYGNVLVIGPWNYPFQLTVGPLIAAWCAGNTAIIKPSELSPATSAVIAEIINSNFSSEQVFVALGGIEETTFLLDQKFDYIFYTGSTNVGRIIMEKASKHLTPVTLELGGKSPCIVDGKQDLATTSKRIAWGKFINAGQTCVAPDYILVHQSIKEEFVNQLKQSIEKLYSTDPLLSPYYGKMINQRHFDRVKGLIEKEKVLYGGVTDQKSMKISPTILNEDGNGLAMKDEIFGPLLPIITYEKIENAIHFIKSRPKPLALYVYSSNDDVIEKVINETNSGGVCVNDCIVHIGTPYLPFGGVGDSGMGAYHGVFSFETFSHKRAIMVRSLWPDLFLRYPPYKIALKWFRILLKYLSH